VSLMPFQQRSRPQPKCGICILDRQGVAYFCMTVDMVAKPGGQFDNL